MPLGTFLLLTGATLFLVGALLTKSTDRIAFFLLAGWGYLLCVFLLGMWMLARRIEHRQGR